LAAPGPSALSESEVGHEVVNAPNRRRRDRVVLLAVLVAVLLGGLTSCGEPDYRFVSNRQLGSFVRIPRTWAVQDLTATQNQGRVNPLPSGIQSVWKLAFVSGDPGNVDDLGLPAEVTGRIEVYKVSDYYREQYSISALRSTQTVGMSVDPVYPPDGVGSERVELGAYEQLDIGGVTGSRSVANLNTASGSDEPKWITQNLTLLFDHGTGQIYVLSMYCSGSCYLANRQAIDEVAASFAVRNDV
jgi:hypothetical protein